MLFQTIRTAALAILPILYMYMGQTLRVLFESEKPALLQQIDAEFAKVGWLILVIFLANFDIVDFPCLLLWVTHAKFTIVDFTLITLLFVGFPSSLVLISPDNLAICGFHMLSLLLLIFHR
jgi:hypothetical protein